MIRDAVIVVFACTAAGYGIVGYYLGTLDAGAFILGFVELTLAVAVIHDHRQD